MSRLRLLSLLACLSLCLSGALPFSAIAQSQALPMPLESDDPDRPLKMLGDATWTGPEIREPMDAFHTLPVAGFTHDGSLGPVTLVVDYAATRPDPETPGEAMIEVEIECTGPGSPCAIPIGQLSIGIHSEYMGESVVNLGAAPEAVWVGREGRGYLLPAGSDVVMKLRLRDRKNLEPKAIRARVFYGTHDNAALPGQKTRFGTVLQVAALLGVLLLGFLWWMRRG